MADPRLVAEAPKADIRKVKTRAKEHGFSAYGPFVVECSLRAYLLPPQLQTALDSMAESEGLNGRDMVATLLLEAVKARQGG